MSTIQTIKAQISELIKDANAAMGTDFADLTTAVDALIAGYGTGGGEVCSHENTTMEYVSSETGSHTAKTVCTDCGEVISEVPEACADETGDGLCDRCGAAVDAGGESGGEEGSCSHSTKSVNFSKNEDGTHTVTTKCKLCEEVLSVENNACMLGAPTITSNGDGTHTTTEICSACYWEKKTTADCTDEDGDGKCDVCGASVESDDYAGEDYTETLTGVQRVIFKVLSGALGCVSDTATDNNVAVGKSINASYGISGKAVTAIPIPEKATKITITFGDSLTEEAEILVIEGEIGAVVSLDSSEMKVIDSTTRQRSMDITAGKYDYVVFNAYGRYSATTAATVGKNATVRFD